MKRLYIVLALGVVVITGCGGSGSGSGGDSGVLAYGTTNPTFDVFAADAHGHNVVNVSDTNAADQFPDVNAATGKMTWSEFVGPVLAIVSDTIPPSNQQILSNASTGERYPRFSKDGTKIVFVSERDDDHNEVYIMNADGSNQTRLTDNDEGNNLPAFSPDGTKIVFVSKRDGNSEIYVMNADGSNQTRLTNTPKNEDFPDWSTDGTKIVFRRGTDTFDMELRTISATDGSSDSLIRTIAFLSYPSVGSDNRAYFTQNINGVDQVCRVDLDGSNFRQMTTSSLNKIAPKLN